MSLAYFNGRFVPLDEAVVPVEERGHQFGDGVYEYMRFYDGKGFMLEEHLDRFYRSAELIRLDPGISRAELLAVMAQLLERSGLSHVDIYMQLTRGIAPRNHPFPDAPASLSMTVKPSREVNPELRKQGASVLLHPDERWMNCHIKSLNLLPNVLAKQAAVDAGCFEAVLVREDGFITEGSSSNMYLVKDGAIRTAPLSNRILPGIRREAVRRIALEAGIPFIEEPFMPAELLAADEAFLTSTGIEIIPVVRIHGQGPIGSGEPGETVRGLHRLFLEKTSLPASV
ncbi:MULTISPECIES: D-amino-acid transaminase [unclassified Paenibacillus]|uniref:D-amino-acid transaminase n=1 Tax=unclassified Paenibacillus TaxID=185978 RepID=UPI000954930E|nr:MULTISPECIES: D-amino-acid transaminase [unclassified Paenibacillus]ASS67409.1 D-amino-acid transaminase [Paenibacillus sp. RUD330]SIQ77993.1 D-alanine transaminase [Paenibacillus sp. RU4X]SIQ99451.1 D-alanine transaminase [Paenibacillus sp. RU4T]